jgi:hypothetical protein
METDRLRVRDLQQPRQFPVAEMGHRERIPEARVRPEEVGGFFREDEPEKAARSKRKRP